VSAALALGGCRTRESDVWSDSSARPVSGPSLSCENPAHDFGRVLEGEPLRHTFRLHNGATSSARIRRVERAYGCAPVDVPAEVPPNAAVDLSVRCETSGRPGKLAELLVVRADEAPGGKLELELRATVEPLLALSPSLVELTPEFGTTQRKEVVLVGALASRARLKVESISDPGPEALVLPAEDGRPPRVVLSLHAAQVDRRAGHVVLATGLPRPERLTLPYSWWVRGNLEISPSTPYINLRSPGSKEVTIAVRSSRKDFHLHAAPVLEGPFVTSVSREQSGPAFLVRVVALEQRIAESGERGVLGKIELISNDPFEPRRAVPVLALGVLNGSSSAAR